MRNVSIEQITRFQEKIIDRTGGTKGIRDNSLIDSAVNRGLGTFGGEDLYETDVEKIAAITHSLITNHCFVDGNKRIGVATMLLLLKLNSIEVFYTQEELIDLGLGVAEGRYKYKEIVSWITEHYPSSIRSD